MIMRNTQSELLEKIENGFANNIEKQLYNGATTTQSYIEPENITIDDIIEANKRMTEFCNKPKLFSELKVVVGVTKKKERAEHFFKKHLNKLGFSKNHNENIDTLVITEASGYKKWNPRNPFRGANHKYQILGVDSQIFKMEIKRPELTYSRGF